MAVADNAVSAGVAYQNALRDYGNFIDSAMREYGWTMPGPTGQYTVANAQDAFDPDRMIQLDSMGRPQIDMQRIAANAASGQYGTTGLFAQTAQESAAQEAELRAQQRSRGFTAGGGLASQQQRLAESVARQQIGAVSGQLMGNLAEVMTGSQQAYQQFRQAQIEDEARNAGNLASMVSPYGSMPSMMDIYGEGAFSGAEMGAEGGPQRGVIPTPPVRMRPLPQKQPRPQRGQQRPAQGRPGQRPTPQRPAQQRPRPAQRPTPPAPNRRGRR